MDRHTRGFLFGRDWRLVRSFVLVSGSIFALLFTFRALRALGWFTGIEIPRYWRTALFVVALLLVVGHSYANSGFLTCLLISFLIVEGIVTAVPLIDAAPPLSSDALLLAVPVALFVGILGYSTGGGIRLLTDYVRATPSA